MTYSTVEAKLKWTVFYEKFNPFLVKIKNSAWAPYEQAKTVLQNFSL